MKYAAIGASAQFLFLFLFLSLDFYGSFLCLIALHLVSDWSETVLKHLQPVRLSTFADRSVC